MLAVPGLLVPFFGVVALVLGVLGIRRAIRAGGSGKRTAYIGTVLGGLGTIATVIVLSSGSHGPSDATSPPAKMPSPSRDQHSAPTAAEVRGPANATCIKAITSMLKAPATARFNIPDEQGFVDPTSPIPGAYVINGTVDAENSFGALIRSDYSCAYKDGTIVRLLFDGSLIVADPVDVQVSLSRSAENEREFACLTNGSDPAKCGH